MQNVADLPKGVKEDQQIALEEGIIKEELIQFSKEEVRRFERKILKRMAK